MGTQKLEFKKSQVVFQEIQAFGRIETRGEGVLSASNPPPPLGAEDDTHQNETAQDPPLSQFIKKIIEFEE